MIVAVLPFGNMGTDKSRAYETTGTAYYPIQVNDPAGLGSVCIHLLPIHGQLPTVLSKASSWRPAREKLPHLSGRSGANQSGGTGTMGEGQGRKEVMLNNGSSFSTRILLVDGEKASTH